MIMERIQEAKAGIRSLTGAIDTTTAPARMVIQKWSEHLLSLKERFSVSEQRLDWTLPVSRGRIGGSRLKL